VSIDLTARIFDALEHGREANRSAAIRDLTERADEVDRARLRLLILDALQRVYYPGREEREQDPSLLWVRSWMLSVLARICDDDAAAAAEVRRHLDPDVEPSYWVQYWTLEGLITSGAQDVDRLAQLILDREDRHDPLVNQLALAILAKGGDEGAWQSLQSALEDPALQWASLRALRIVPIPPLLNRIHGMVDRGDYSDETFDAIVALGKMPRESPHAEGAARTLANFVARWRTSPLRDGMRTAAIKALGELRVASFAPLLIEELLDDNPAVVRDAARGLEKLVGVGTAASRVVEAAAAAASDERVEALGRALRWMDRATAVEELETLMVAGPQENQDAARRLLSEIGGAAAFEKLRARTTAIAQYTGELEKAEEKIRQLFSESIHEARIGFRLSTLMDLAVFALGFALIGVSAALILRGSGTLDSWAGVGLTGGTGVLGVLYSLLVARPRRQVVDAVDHLMHLKILFLSYLRQLHQADQAYTRHLLEEKPMSADEVARFTRLVESTMRITIGQLRALRPQGEPAAEGREQEEPASE
jgi:HEAT repeat protein